MTINIIYHKTNKLNIKIFERVFFRLRGLSQADFFVVFIKTKLEIAFFFVLR